MSAGAAEGGHHDLPEEAAKLHGIETFREIARGSGGNHFRDLPLRNPERRKRLAGASAILFCGAVLIYARHLA